MAQGYTARLVITLEDGWAFGSTRSIFLVINNDGTWNATTPGEYQIRGTWTATAVGAPEPFTVLGSITAAITGYTPKCRPKQSA